MSSDRPLNKAELDLLRWLEHAHAARRDFDGFDYATRCGVRVECRPSFTLANKEVAESVDVDRPRTAQAVSDLFQRGAHNTLGVLLRHTKPARDGGTEFFEDEGFVRRLHKPNNTMKQKQKQREFVFWSYDLFPYMLGSELIELHDNGMAEPKGYGGMRFRPIKILPLKEGLEIHEEIVELKELRSTLLGQIEDLCQAKLDQIARFNKGKS